MKHADSSNYLIDFEFGDDEPVKPLAKYFYFNTRGSYSELALDYHYATVEVCPACIQWLRTPSDMKITCTDDFKLVPLMPLVYATVNGHGRLEVIRELGGNMNVGVPPMGYELEAGADLQMADRYKERVRVAQEERMRLTRVGKEAEAHE